MKLSRLWLLSVLGMVLLVSSSSIPSTFGQAQSFVLTVSPNLVHLTRNEPGFFSIRVFSTGGFTGTVTFRVTGFESLPETITGENIITSFEPTSIFVPPDAYAYSQLRITDTVPAVQISTIRNRPITFTVFATGGGITQAVTANVILLAQGTPDVTVSLSPNTDVFQPGAPQSTVQADFIVQSRNGFTGQMFFTLNDPPFGVSAVFDPASINIGPNQVLRTRMTITITPAFIIQTGMFYFAVSVTGGRDISVTKTALFLLVVNPDFTVRASPTTQEIRPGESTSYQVEIASIAGAFASTVTFSLEGLPTDDAQFQFNPTTVVPLAGETQRTTLTIATTERIPPATYELMLKANALGLIRTIRISMTVDLVGDFTLDVNPNIIVVPPGASTTAQLDVKSTGSFKSRVSFSISSLPSGITATFSPSSVRADPNVDQLSTLTMSAATSTTQGSFAVDVQAISGDIARTQRISLRVTTSGCLIATATYGSELAPQVQLLRDFRDNDVKSTVAGSEFLQAFNLWYYSFSPDVARFISNHGTVRETMKVVLYPLIGSLYLSTVTFKNLNSVNPELGIVVAGALASSLIGAIYLSPMILGLILVGRFAPAPQGRQLKMMLQALGGVSAMLILAEIIAIPALLAILASAFVITILCLSGWISASTIVRLVRKKD